MIKTFKGLNRKQLTGDGRENPNRHIERQLGMRPQTKTKKKRQKKEEEKMVRMLQDQII